MKVLHVIRDLDINSGGPPRSVSMTAHYLALMPGVEASLFYENTRDNTYRPKHLSHLQRFEIDSKTASGYRSVKKRLESAVAESSTDVIHVHGLWSPLAHYACRFAREQRLPYVIAPRGMLEPWALKQKRMKKLLALFLYQRKDLNGAAVIHATAESEANSIKELGVSTKVEVIPNGTEIPESLFPKPQNEKKRALFLSRIHPKKGLMDLVAAWKQIAPPDWECVIAGTNEDGYASEVDSAIRRHGLSECMRLHPSVDGAEKWSLYRSADLFVLPSHSENFGLVIAEALASAVPVITTVQTPWRELLSHRCGWWIEDNAVALAMALREATNLSVSERSEMGLRGRSLIQTKYTWPAVAMKLAETYRALITT